MSIIFAFISIICIIYLLFTAPEVILSSMISGAKDGLLLCFTLCSIYIVWLSILEMMTRLKVSFYLAAAFRPITARLFKGENDDTRGLISLCLATNMIGLGSAATPLGIKAMENMSSGKNTATRNMIMFIVINATSIQLLPATVIAMRANAGSVSPSDIIIPTLLATICTTFTGIIMVYLFVRDKYE